MFPPWAWVVIAIVVVIIIVVIIVVVTSPTSPAPPQQLTFSWVDSNSVAEHPNHVPVNGVYTLASDTSLTSYNVAISDVMLNSTVLYKYVITGPYPDANLFDTSNLVFVKYVDSTNANKFALLFHKESIGIYVFQTSVDVGDLLDPTKYTGTWIWTLFGITQNTTGSTSSIVFV